MTAHSLPAGMEPGLEEDTYYDPANFTYPNSAHIAQVEIDKETGQITIQKYFAVDDVGNVINPMIVRGQVVGGIAQGVGQALWEGAQYDASRQLVTGSLIDYTMPRADGFPMIQTSRTVTPSPHNPLGVKGVGNGHECLNAHHRECGDGCPGPAGREAHRQAADGRKSICSHPRCQWRRSLMYPPKFDYYRAASPDEATALVQEHGGKFLAGGHSLIPVMNLRLADPGALVDIGQHHPNGLAKTRMAKSVLDAGWSSFRNMLAYKAARFVEVDENFTTQTCSSCGALPPERPKGIAGLGIRSWDCSACGASHDRDVNAALNILRIVRSVTPLVEGSRMLADRPES